MEDDFFPRNTNQQDLYDEDVDPQVLNIEDDDDPSESLDIHSTAQIYSSATGKIAVPQHIHYSHRGVAFKEYSLYEFAAIVDVVQRKKENNPVNSTSDEFLTSSTVIDEQEEFESVQYNQEVRNYIIFLCKRQNL